METVGDTHYDTFFAVFVTLMSGIVGLPEKWNGGGDALCCLGVGLASFRLRADWQY